MRIPSGKTDQYIYFVAVDDADGITRLTGLSGFTVYRSRNNGSATAYTTPTVNELSSANMPGVYALLIDEDTTIASGSDSEAYTVHITKTGMRSVTREIELYRDLPADAKTRFDTLDSTLSTIAGYLDTEIAAILADTNELQTDWVNGGRLDLLIDAIKAKTDNLPSDPADASDIASSFSTVNSTLSTIAGYVDTEVAAIKAVTDKLDTALESDGGSGYQFTTTALENAPTGGSAPTASEIADAVWDEALSGHTTAGSAGKALSDIDTHTDTETGAAAIRAAVGLASANLDTQLSSLDTKLDTIDNYVDTEVAAIKAKTDNLPSDPADASVIAGRFDTLDAAIAAIDVPTANEVRDAVFAQSIDGYTLLQHMRGFASIMYGPWAKSGSIKSFKDVGNTKTRVSATEAAASRSTPTLDLD